MNAMKSTGNSNLKFRFNHVNSYTDKFQEVVKNFEVLKAEEFERVFKIKVSVMYS